MKAKMTIDVHGGWKCWWGAMPLPATAVALGTIERSDCGALIYIGASGQLVQGNAGVIRSLPIDARTCVIDSIPELLRAGRKRHEHTQSDAADAMRVRCNTVARWERGQETPKSLAQVHDVLLYCGQA